MRTASVFTPRSTSHESNGERIAPTAFCKKPICSAISSEFDTTTPPTESECPFRNFVVECTTISAPSSMGRCRYGEQNVLSTTTSTSDSCAMSAHAAISVIVIIGFVGVSRKTMRVDGRMARRTSSAIDVSTYVKSTPNFSTTRLKSRYEPPYMFSPAMT